MIVTDADGCMAEGLIKEVHQADGQSAPEHALDTVHLNRTVKRTVSSVKLDINSKTSQSCSYAH